MVMFRTEKKYKRKGTDRQTRRDRDRQTNKDRDRESERERERETSIRVKKKKKADKQTACIWAFSVQLAKCLPKVGLGNAFFELLVPEVVLCGRQRR